MIAEVKIAIMCIDIGAAVAVPFAILLPRLQPRWYRRLTTARSFALGTLGVVFCVAAAILHFAQGRPHLGGFFASLGTMGLFVLSISALRLLMGAEDGTQH
jgi:hypothetical protein